MPAATLEKMCKRRLVRAIDMLTDVGDLPYHVVEDVLSRIENPNQLASKKIEKNSPQIVGATRETWLRYIKRDIPNWEKRMREPWNPAKWCSNTYYKLQLQHDKEVEASEARLLAAISQTREEKKSRQLEFIETINDPKTKKRKPRDVIPRPRNSMDRVRREMGATKRKDPMTTPSHLLGRMGSGVTQIPHSMLVSPVNRGSPVQRPNQSNPAAAPQQWSRATMASAKPIPQPGPSFLQTAAAANRKRKVPDKIFGPAKRRA